MQTTISLNLKKDYWFDSLTSQSAIELFKFLAVIALADAKSSNNKSSVILRCRRVELVGSTTVQARRALAAGQGLALNVLLPVVLVLD